MPPNNTPCANRSACHTEHLEELVASRTRELLEAHRVAVVGETVACMAHTIKNLAAALEGSLFVLKQGMESGNREYLDDGWAMLEEDISRVRDKLLHLLRIGQQTELRECLVDPVQPSAMWSSVWKAGPPV